MAAARIAAISDALLMPRVFVTEGTFSLEVGAGREVIYGSIIAGESMGGRKITIMSPKKATKPTGGGNAGWSSRNMMLHGGNTILEAEFPDGSINFASEVMSEVLRILCDTEDINDLSAVLVDDSVIPDADAQLILSAVKSEDPVMKATAVNFWVAAQAQSQGKREYEPAAARRW